MTASIYVYGHWRTKPAPKKKPEKRREYVVIHNRLFDEVMFLQTADRHLEEELAMQMEAELEEWN
jgi:hypothetical protein